MRPAIDLAPATPLLDAIDAPEAVKALPEADLPRLAAEIRARMVAIVSRTGGHLAPSLGVVELALALCRVFDFPQDKVVWDVGHQAYAWKMLTGRNARMETLRRFGGIRGFPFPDESPYDASVGGHAGVALATALGFAVARDARGGQEHVIAVVGDASLTNGISLEALNAVRHATDRLILVINDNGMSISRNVGALARLFARQLTGLRYNRIRAAAEAAGHRLRLNRTAAFWRGLKTTVKTLLLRNRSAIFEDLGLRYIGPIDGHDLPALCDALRTAAEAAGPIALHIATVKGKGYAPAERNPSKWHGVGPWAADARKNAAAAPPAPSWSAACGLALARRAQGNPAIHAITAAMRSGTGLTPFFRDFPTRAHDVGICEGYAVAFAAGLAAAGLRPVVALYSTFAQRAVDNVMHDVCLPNLPVVLCLDRAGVVGPDGPTHHGLYDLAMLRALPNLTILAPATRPGLEAALDHAFARPGPTVIRYPRGAAPEGPAPRLPGATPQAPIILALGPTVFWAEPVARALGLALEPVERVKPLPDILRALTPGRPIITLEDAAAEGGFGSAVAEVWPGPLLVLGWPDRFVPQGSEGELRAACGLDAHGLRMRIAAFLGGLPGASHA